MRTLIYLIILALAIILSSFIPFAYNHLTIFTPSLLIVSIPILLKISQKNFYLLLFLFMIYDLLFSSIFLLSLLLHFLILIVFAFFMNKDNFNLLKILILTILAIVFYDTCLFLVNNLMTSYTLKDLIYKITNTLTFNIIFLLIFYPSFNRSQNIRKNKKLKLFKSS